MCHTESRLAYLSYVTRALFHRRWTVPGIELAYSGKVKIDYAASSGAESERQSKVYVEADGELLGTLPAEITMVPDALTILTPVRR